MKVIFLVIFFYGFVINNHSTIAGTPYVNATDMDGGTTTTDGDGATTTTDGDGVFSTMHIYPHLFTFSQYYKPVTMKMPSPNSNTTRISGALSRVAEEIKSSVAGEKKIGETSLELEPQTGKPGVIEMKNGAEGSQSPCEYPRYSENVDIVCRVYYDHIHCVQLCKRGFTLPEGRTRTLTCSFEENVWRPIKMFEPCQHINNCDLHVGPGASVKCNTMNHGKICQISCRPWGEHPETPVHSYQCTGHGLWTPGLPFCVIPSPDTYEDMKKDMNEDLNVEEYIEGMTDDVYEDRDYMEYEDGSGVYSTSGAASRDDTRGGYRWGHPKSEKNIYEDEYDDLYKDVDTKEYEEDFTEVYEDMYYMDSQEASTPATPD